MINTVHECVTISIPQSAEERVPIQIGPVDVDLVQYQYSLNSWTYRDTPIPGFKNKTLLGEFRFDPPWYDLRAPDEAKKVGRDFLNLLALFIHGVFAGWSTVEFDVQVAGSKTRDQIDMHKYVASNSDSLGLTQFGIKKSQVRRLCQEDAISFALARYAEEGSDFDWDEKTITEFGWWRFPYDSALKGGVVQDLVREGYFQGTSDGKVTLRPNIRSLVESEVEVAHQKWIEFLNKTGRCLGWAEPDVVIDSDEDMDVESTPMIARETEVMSELRVFIVHGHLEAKWRELKELLEQKFKVPVVIMQEQPGQSRTLIEKFEEEAVRCNAAIAVMTPDDIIQEAPNGQGQPRPNVIYELGWFAGKYGRNRTLMVVKEGTTIPSDLEGIQRIQFAKDISEKYLELDKEISAWRSA